MLRDELDFKMRMRASLRGIVQLDPETIPARLVELDREIRELEATLVAAPVVRDAPRGCELRAA